MGVAIGAAVALLLGPSPTSAAAPDVKTSAPRAAATKPAHSVLESVPELEKPVTVAETKIPLSELVQKVSEETGVPLTAAREVADEPVALAVTAMPARELLQQIADLLDYQWHRVPGPRTPNTEHRTPILEIYQDLASKQREEALRQARVAEVVRQLQEELKRCTELAALSPEAFQHLSDEADRYWQEWWQLTRAQQQARLQGPLEKQHQERFSGIQELRSPIARALAALLSPALPIDWAHLPEETTVTWSSDPKPGYPPQAGEQRLPLEVERHLREAKPSWLAPGVHPAFPEPGEEERTREREGALQEAWAAASGYRVTLRLDARQLQTRGALMLYLNAVPFRNGAPLSAELPPVPFSGTSLTLHSEAPGLLAQLGPGSPEREAALERDPVVGPKRKFSTAVKSRPNGNGLITPSWWSLWDLLPELARTYGVDFISDSYWGRAPGFGRADLPREPIALYTLLDRATRITHEWDRRNTLIRLRSRTWFLDRPREVPLRYVRRWKALVDERGALPLESCLELVTTLSDDQIESLPQLVDIAGLPRDLVMVALCRDMLRLYASLTPSQQQALRHGAILPLPRMTPRQQALFLVVLKGLPRAMPPEERTPDQLDRVGLSLKPVSMIRTTDRSSGSVSDEPAAAAPPAPGPAPAPRNVERVPVTQLQFRLVYGQEQRGGVAIVTASSP
jgi:hypothetical protein